MGPIKLKVSTLQHQYFAGSVVKGSVEVQVCTKNKKECSADELKFRLVGHVKTAVDYRPTKGEETKMAREDKEILSYDVQLGSFGGKAASGVHNFPFSVTLPAGLPPSMAVSPILTEHGGEGSCSIEYGFEAHLHRPGLLNFDVKDNTALKVLGTPQPAGAALPVMAGPATQPVKFCCCFNRGSMSIGFRMNASTVGPDDFVSLDVVARNNSSSRVTQMLIELKQETKWNAHRHHDKRTRTIASVVVPASELGELQWAAGPGTERGQSVAVVESNARQDLEQQLSAGRSTRVELKVPGNALLTTQAPNISVSHTVGVVLDTPCCIGAPTVWTPLYLQVGAGGTEVQPGGGSVVLAQAAPCPSPQTMPYPAGPTQPSPYLAPQTPQYSTGPYGPAQYSTGPYGSAQTVPYPTPQGATYGAPPEASLGYTPGIQCYPTHQAVAAVKVDENGRVIPRVVPHGGG